MVVVVVVVGAVVGSVREMYTNKTKDAEVDYVAP